MGRLIYMSSLTCLLQAAAVCQHCGNDLSYHGTMPWIWIPPIPFIGPSKYQLAIAKGAPAYHHIIERRDASILGHGKDSEIHCMARTPPRAPTISSEGG